MNISKVNTISAQPLNCQPLRVIKNQDNPAFLGKRLNVICDKARSHGDLGQRLSLLA